MFIFCIFLLLLLKVMLIGIDRYFFNNKGDFNNKIYMQGKLFDFIGNIY